MADTYGAIELPVLAPNASPATFDPALDVLCGYLKAIVNAQLTTAWQARSPNELPIAFTFPGENPEAPPVTPFNDRALPALFAYRKGGPAPYDHGADMQISEDTIVLLWVPSEAKQEINRLRAGIVGTLCKVVNDAVWKGRHPAYAAPLDTEPTSATLTAVLSAVLLTKATLTSSHTYAGAGLDGSIGPAAISPPRPVTVVLGGTAGDFTLGSTIVVSGTNVIGYAQTDTFVILTGAETFSTSHDYKSVTSVAVDAQTGTAGTITAGVGAYSGYGSDLLIAMGAMGITPLKQAVYRYLNIKTSLATSNARAMQYPCIEFNFKVREQQVRDETLFTDNTETEFTLTREDGSAIESAELIAT